MSSKFICKRCGLDCHTSLAYDSHSKKCTGTSTAATAAGTTARSTATAATAKPVAIEQSAVTTPAETVITVRPTVEIADPFLSTRVVPPYTGTGPGESAKPATETAATATTTARDVAIATAASEQLATVPEQVAATPEQPATVTPEQPAVEPQKKTATATVGATTASGTPLQVQLPPMHFHIPTAPAEGRRDQPQPEAKPSLMMPPGSITKEIEVTIKAMEIQIGSTVLMYYDWLRGRGYERSLSELNQTVRA